MVGDEPTTNFYPWPFLPLFQICGIVSYRKSKDKIFKMSDILAVYSSIGVCLLLHLRLEYCYFIRTRIDDFFIFIFVILHGIGCHFVTISEFLMISVKNSRLCDIAVKIVNLREKLKRPESKNLNCLRLGIFLLCFFQSFLYIHSLMVRNISVLRHCNWFFSTFNIYSLILDIFLLLYVGNIEAVLSDLNLELSALKVEKIHGEKVNRMKRLRKNHGLALDVVADFNECFGLIILISSFKEFVVFVCTPFYAMVNPSTILGVQEYVVWFLRYFITYLAKLVTFTLTCKQGKRMTNRIHEMFIESDDINLKEEIEIFSLQLLHRKVEFDAFGFFKMDFTLLYSMVGAVTTYIIILYQFQDNMGIVTTSCHQ